MKTREDEIASAVADFGRGTPLEVVLGRAYDAGRAAQKRAAPSMPPYVTEWRTDEHDRLSVYGPRMVLLTIRFVNGAEVKIPV